MQRCGDTCQVPLRASPCPPLRTRRRLRGSRRGSSGSVRFLVFGDPEELKAYRTLIEAYEEERPDIESS